MKEIVLSPKQVYALQRLLDGYTTTVLYGGAGGGGKSWLGCVWILLMVLSYPYTKWFIARSNMTKVKKSTLQTFWKVCREYGVSESIFHFNNQTNMLTCKQTGATVELINFSYMPSNPDFDQFGSMEYTGGWMEEVQEAIRAAYSALLTRIGRAENEKYNIKAKLFLTCNPKKNWLYSDFYQPWKNGKLPLDTTFIQAFCHDNGYLPKEYIENLENITDLKLRQRILNGEWEYNEDEAQVIRYDWLYQCLGADAHSGRNTLGVDVARDGGKADLTVIQPLLGNRIVRPILLSGREYRGSPDGWDEYCADAIIRAALANSVKAEDVRIDTTGPGSGVWSVLRSKGWTTTRFVAGNSPVYRHNDPNQYRNLRTQVLWELREAVRLKKLSFDDQYDSVLFDDLCGYHYSISEKVIILEDKMRTRARIGRSPDRGDALAMAFYSPKPVSTSSAQSVKIERPKSSL